jgi:hypothetical protein
MTSMARALIGAVLLAAATVAAWWLWLGRDTGYQIDADGHQTGPYTTGQVAGCVLTLLVLLVSTVLAGVPALPAAAAMTAGFTAAWTAQAAATDETGLFLVGALLVFAGTAAGTALVALLTGRLRARFIE